MDSTYEKAAGAIRDTGSPTTAQKLRFLSDPSAYPHAPSTVTVVETHMSYVFLAGDKAYKLKKPVRYPFLDFSTLDARERNCREEARLNRRLAADVYLGVLPLTFDGARVFALGGDGAVVDWLVEMRRLPQEAMLDRLISDGRLTEARIDAVCDTFGGFLSPRRSFSDRRQRLCAAFLSRAGKESRYSDAKGFRARPRPHARSARSTRRETRRQPLFIGRARRRRPCRRRPRRSAPRAYLPLRADRDFRLSRVQRRAASG